MLTYADKKLNLEGFDWYYSSYILPMYYSDYFEYWWDSYKYNWEFDSWALAEYCPNKIEKWWSPYLFNWEDSYAVVCLCKYCSDYFDIWFEPSLFNWEYGAWALIEYCPQHKEKYSKG